MRLDTGDLFPAPFSFIVSNLLTGATPQNINQKVGIRCDVVHLRWDVPKPLRYIKITCDVLRCIFQHVGISAPDFGISKLFIIRFSNGLQYCDGDSIPFHVICNSKLSS